MSWHQIMHDGLIVYGYGSEADADAYCALRTESTGYRARHYDSSDTHVRAHRIAVGEDGGFDLRAALDAVKAAQAI